MIDIKHQKCKQESCEKRPNYNYENENIGIYCREHAEKTMVDILHKKCKIMEQDRYLGCPYLICSAYVKRVFLLSK